MSILLHSSFFARMFKLKGDWNGAILYFKLVTVVFIAESSRQFTKLDDLVEEASSLVETSVLPTDIDLIVF